MEASKLKEIIENLKKIEAFKKGWCGLPDAFDELTNNIKILEHEYSTIEANKRNTVY
jgi:hypothetical protein